MKLIGIKKEIHKFSFVDLKILTSHIHLSAYFLKKLFVEEKLKTEEEETSYVLYHL